jgi:hypothetical protein
MSNTTPKPETNDPLLAALRQLPPHTPDAAQDTRLQREARAAYVRTFEGSTWHGSAGGKVGRFAMPVFLAGIVGLYMTWAIAAATAIVH